MPSKIGAVQNAILCDDIRQERDTNKHILIGVFSGDLVLPIFPGAIAPMLYLEYVAKKPGNYEFAITYEVAGKSVTPFKGNLAIVRPGVTALALPQYFVEVAEPTEIEITLTVADEKPIRLVKKKIITPEMAANASPPPS